MSNDLILVCGDAMIDHHVYGNTNRTSPEAPVPVVLKEREEWVLGAAANVAAHITSAGVDCMLAFKTHSRLGSYIDSRFYTMCADKKILTRPLYFSKECPTTVKTRIWSQGQQVCRIDHENVDPPAGDLECQWISEIGKIIKEHPIKVVVFSDYNKGALTDGMIYNISRLCQERNVPTVLDPKRPSFYKIKGLTMVKPNVRELNSTNMSPRECSAEMGGCWLIHTLGPDGMVVYYDGGEQYRCPTVAEEVVDVCGCGDTVTALLAIATMRGARIQSATKAANKGASFTIKHKGCYVLSKDEMEICLDG